MKMMCVSWGWGVCSTRFFIFINGFLVVPGSCIFQVKKIFDNGVTRSDSGGLGQRLGVQSTSCSDFGQQLGHHLLEQAPGATLPLCATENGFHQVAQIRLGAAAAC